MEKVEKFDRVEQYEPMEEDMLLQADRQTLIRYIRSMEASMISDGKVYNLAVEKAENCEPVIHAHWENITGDYEYAKRYKCSRCGRAVYLMPAKYAEGINHHYPYCWCGAKMDGEVLEP